MRDGAGPSQCDGGIGEMPSKGVNAHKGAHGAFWRIATGIARLVDCGAYS